MKAVTLKMHRDGNKWASTERLAKAFQEHPNEWIPLPKLFECTRPSSIHIPLSILKTIRGWRIENRQEVVSRGGIRVVHSFYIYYPDDKEGERAAAAEKQIEEYLAARATAKAKP